MPLDRIHHRGFSVMISCKYPPAFSGAHKSHHLGLCSSEFVDFSHIQSFRARCRADEVEGVMLYWSGMNRFKNRF